MHFPKRFGKPKQRNVLLGHDDNGIGYYAVLEEGEPAVLYRGFPEAGNAIKARDLPLKIRKDIAVAYAVRYKHQMARDYSTGLRAA